MPNTISRFRYCLLAAATLMLIIVGCTTPIPQDSLLEKNWGRSYETQLHLQTADPHAGKQTNTVMIMDGGSSEHAMEAYRKSFSTEKEEKTVNIIKLR